MPRPPTQPNATSLPEPIRVQRRASVIDVIVAAGQKLALQPAPDRLPKVLSCAG